MRVHQRLRQNRIPPVQRVKDLQMLGMGFHVPLGFGKIQRQAVFARLVETGAGAVKKFVLGGADNLQMELHIQPIQTIAFGDLEFGAGQNIAQPVKGVWRRTQRRKFRCLDLVDFAQLHCL